MDEYLARLTTEEVNESTKNIDECTTEEMLALINEQDKLVPLAVEKEIPNIARAVDILYEALLKGGKMFYIGAGSSGRIGVLDASECPPTYGTDPQLVQAYIAGGDIALRLAVEGCEDDGQSGAEVVREHGVTSKDVVVGITASGGAAFVLGAVNQAKQIGAATIGVVTNKDTMLSDICDVCIAPIVGPEVIIGSTRMKSGTAQKLVLNMLTTCTMVKLGKVYGNLMVDLKATNKKLYDRAVRIVTYTTGVSAQAATKYLDEAQMNTKLAIMMIKTGLDAEHAQMTLDRHGGVLKDAIQAVNCEKAMKK